MSHASGTVILRVPLPHDEDEHQENNHLRREPSVFIEAPKGCSEDDCAELVRLAYRKIVRRQ